MKRSFIAIMILNAFTFVTGCGGAGDAVTQATNASLAVDSSKYMLMEEPEEALGIIEARESASDGDPLVVVGRIGGTTSPWVEGRAAFTLLDASILLVAEGAECGEGELCSGDCCAAERAHATMLVKITDLGGRVLAVDARRLLGLAENDMVVVRGKASKDDSGNVALIADGVFVRR
jgi:hypothetical protein